MQDLPVELPMGYDRAWINERGEYIVSEDPNYDPNIGTTLHWREMRSSSRASTASS